MKNIFNLTEIELIKIVQDKKASLAKKEMAKERLFIMHKNLVKSIALKFVNVDCELQDLIQEGYRGLFIAINKFDTKRNLKLSTYAYQWIFQSIQRSVGINSRVINVPQSTREKYNYLIKVKQDFYETCGYYPSVSELANTTGMKKEKIIRILHSCQGVQSLDYVVSNKNSKDSSCSLFIKDDKLSIDKQIIQDENNIELYGLLKEILSDREYSIISLKAGLNSEELTIKEIAIKLRLSVPRIKQILKEISNKIYACKGIRDIWMSSF